METFVKLYLWRSDTNTINFTGLYLNAKDISIISTDVGYIKKALSPYGNDEFYHEIITNYPLPVCERGVTCKYMIQDCNYHELTHD